ncbi:MULTISPECIES: hypothetical protein [unclassified Mesorhizobium]|uniref:hypothetical protein n=1 Tax=unclassified Mesorhizobium TaxID=325217 RepID=UPI00112AC117|nr:MULTISPECIES: hypothetical protein [unclassified Mesorhizobium]TPJ51742.1 hypothetical protein FJ426_18725 [Mesorhizobium sp. B2-6-4]TPN42364.1 hypothetical protein FJ979_02140 [Mesorhizobium sp. B1-1-6]
MRVLPDLSQKPRRGQRLAHTVLVREDGFSQSHSLADMVHRVWNGFSLPKVACTAPEREALERVSARPSRQHQAPVRRNARRLYSPQDQRGVETVFVIMDRQEGQVLARVKGGALHAEVEAEKLARSQGFELSDLKVIFEGELS